MMDLAVARRAMIDSQVRTNDVTDVALLDAMADLPRERFLPADSAPLAYLDRDLPLGGRGAAAERWLMKPMVLARLIQAAEVQPQDRVLVVACGTGYSAALLARLAVHVVALESDAKLAALAQACLAAVGVSNVTVATAPFDRAGPGPYDVVLIDGGVEFVPQPLCDVLAPGGRLLAVVSAGPVGKATYFQSINGEVGGRPLFDAMLPVLPEFKKAPAFVF
jgi:protein-L-isoaspartate(D-aspartate) O-methyltransferase